ncbi:hypothetical protein ACFVAV_27295 [Nocardia sp. NPDC057663]|uniref:hypothetical protein n=1 Tax=Nocardia sp. NPDC057663 TaxID=3346201 RepID=UPI00366D2AC3
MRIAAAGALSALILSGCAGIDAEKGPTNDDILRGTGLTVAAAKPIVADNFELVWPEQQSVDPEAVLRGKGCRTKMSAISSEGPPWHPRYEREVINPSQEFIDRAMVNLEAMTARGFTLVPSQNPGEDPVSRYYRDSRGFSVSSSRIRVGQNKQEVRFSIASTSPCAAE